MVTIVEEIVLLSYSFFIFLEINGVVVSIVSSKLREQLSHIG